MKKHFIGLALSGGGARGIAHIGVLQALDDYGIQVGMISGTSMGAIVGALYCAGVPPLKIFELVRQHRFSRLFSIRMGRLGLLNIDKLKDIMEDHFEDDCFESLITPFNVCVTNLNTGEFEVKNQGYGLLDYVLASSAIPLIFKPKTLNGQTYVDGGLTNNLPVEPLFDSCEKVIGVHVNHKKVVDNIKGVVSIIERSYQLTIWQTVKDRLASCDLIIDPAQIRGFGIFDFHKAEDIFALGYREAEKQIYRLTKGLNINKIIDLHERIEASKREKGNL